MPALPAKDTTHYTTATEIAEWLASIAGQGFTRLELRSDKGGPVIKNWPELPTPEDVPKQAEIALQRATNRGHSVRGMVAIFLLEAIGPNDARDSCEIVVPGGWAQGEAPDMSPMERYARDLQRHNMELNRVLLSSEDMRARSAERLIEKQGALLDQADGRRVQMFDLIESLISRDFERNMAQRAADESDKRYKWLFEQVNILTPVAMSRLFGSGPGKGTPFFGEEILKRILASLTPEQVDVFMEKLHPEQAMAFGELYMAYAKRHEEEEKRKINNEANGNGATARNGKINNGAPDKGPTS